MLQPIGVDARRRSRPRLPFASLARLAQPLRFRLHALPAALSVALAGTLFPLPSACARSEQAHGISAAATVDPLERLLEHRDYLTLRSRVATLPVHFATDATPRAYYEGVLANRENRIADSIRLLNSVLPRLRADGDHGKLRLALLALADDYVKSYRYALAADTFGDLLTRLGPTLSAGDRADNQASLTLFGALRSVRPQTVGAYVPFSLPLQRDPAGLLTLAAIDHHIAERWEIDTGASLSTAAQSTAERLRMRFLAGPTIPVASITGKPVPARLAVAKSVHVGSATLHDIVFWVLPDHDLYLTSKRYQVHATLGFPALAGLGRLTFTRGTGTLRVAPFAASDVPGVSSNLFLEALQPVVAASMNHQPPYLFTLDTGARKSFLSLRYFDENRARLSRAAPAPFHLAGAGGGKTLPAVALHDVTLRFSTGRPAMLRTSTVLAARVGEPQDSYYGNLGQDVLGQYSAYTLDFHAMRLTLSP